VTIRCYKYQATGNDFILVDNRQGDALFSDSQIDAVCDRRFGIGADGIIFLENDPAADFRMVYHNRDGSKSFCGNGCRAAVHFANHLGLIGTRARFMAHDGMHEAEILPDGHIRVSLLDVKAIEQKTSKDFFVNTGTDHHVRFVNQLETYPVEEEGKKIRYGDMYKPRGTNANFVEIGGDGKVSFRIYERGVESETYSSGSGATACALVASFAHHIPSPVHLSARGGNLVVDFENPSPGTFSRIHFTGPVQLVFETHWSLP